MFLNEEVLRDAESRVATVTRTTADESVEMNEAILESDRESAASGRKIHRIRLSITPGKKAARPSKEGAADVQKRMEHARFGGAVPSAAEVERFIGANDLVDENYLERALVAARPVCRLVFKDLETGRQAFATGFMISPQLLLTNWHVFPVKEAAEGGVAEFDYKLDIRGLEVTPTRFQLQPNVFFTSNKELDYAVVAVASTSIDGARQLTDFGHHRLVEERGKLAKDEPITIIQHPSGGRRQIALRENELIEEPAPEDLFLWYRSDTAKGSSGAPAFNDSWQVVALHHSGKARQDNGLYVLRNGKRVQSLKGVEETDVEWVANEGLRVSVLCRSLRDSVKDSAIREELIAAMTDTDDIMSRSLGAQESLVKADRVPRLTPSALPGSGLFPAVNGLQFHAEHINFAQQIIFQGKVASVGSASRRDEPAAPAVATRQSDDEALAEKLVAPVIDRHYSNRKGYDENFTGISVPLPKVRETKTVSKMENGEHVIPYEHFSVVMNKKRRLALFTASNVYADAKARKPDPDALYTRKALTGLGKNDQELWLTDPRIPEEHQLPDVFYTKDRKSFDKGHIVRREDVCWGRTFAQLRRANGDTFHTTNCSPQVKDFNRSGEGGKWGQLENMILTQAKAERLSIFAGPILEDDDDVFQGVDERGTVSVQIPRRYWKIVLANANGKLMAFGFLLQQDLSSVALEPEFAVSTEWAPFMKPISEIEKLLGVTFDQAIHKADQIEAEAGNEVAKLTEASLGMTA